MNTLPHPSLEVMLAQGDGAALNKGLLRTFQDHDVLLRFNAVCNKIDSHQTYQVVQQGKWDKKLGCPTYQRKKKESCKDVYCFFPFFSFAIWGRSFNFHEANNVYLWLGFCPSIPPFQLVLPELHSLINLAGIGPRQCGLSGRISNPEQFRHTSMDGGRVRT